MSKNWYILHTYTGYEGKIERTIRSLLEKNEIDPEVILDVKVPVEELVEIKDGKESIESFSERLIGRYLCKDLCTRNGRKL